MCKNLCCISIVLVILTFLTLNAHAEPEKTVTKSRNDVPATPAALPAKIPLTAGKPLAAVAVEGKVDATPPQNTSVLERFRSFSGQRTPAALGELFTAPVSSRIRQQPEIALSSGAITISIRVMLSTPDSTAPNFAFNGARLLSYKQSQKGEWQIEALPDAGTWKAELIVLTDSAALEFPLVVAPPLPAETDLSEQGFIGFLGGKDHDMRPLQDLNGDGRIDYLDDYIFTANYLVRKLSPATTPVDIQGPDTQDTGNIEGTVPQQEPLIEKSPEPQRTPSQSSDPHNLTNRNQRARQMKQFMQNQ